MSIVYILLAVLYLTLFVALGVNTFRKGHYVLFFVGIVFPVLWIVGALMEPTAHASAAAARTSP
jgi:hypothetical protein